LRIYASADGQSHFREIEIPTTRRSIHPDAEPFEISAHYPASRVRFTRIPTGTRPVGWHMVPERVLTMRLDGAVEYETSDGEVRPVPAGTLVLVEDTHGKGHLSRHSPRSADGPMDLDAIWTGRAADLSSVGWPRQRMTTVGGHRKPTVGD
jgi:hypothetical protein